MKRVELQPAFTILEEENTHEGSLVMILQRIQEKYGFLPKDVLEMLAKRMNIPTAKILGTATFYAQFRFEPIGKYVIRVCHGTACHIAGAPKLTDVVKETIGVDVNETTKDRLFTLERVACLGCCGLAPAMMINEKVYGNLTPDKIGKIIKDYRKGTT